MNDLSCTNKASYPDILGDRNCKNTKIELTKMKNYVAWSKIKYMCVVFFLRTMPDSCVHSLIRHLRISVRSFCVHELVDPQVTLLN